MENVVVDEARSDAELEDWYHGHVWHVPADMHNLGNAAFWYCDACESWSEDNAPDAYGIKHGPDCIAEIIERFLYGEAA